MTLLAALVDTWRHVRSTRARNAKVSALAGLLATLAPDEIRIGAAYLAGDLPQGKIGVGYRALQAIADTPAASAPSLALGDIDTAFSAIQAIAGAGSVATRRDALSGLFARCTAPEQAFLAALLSGGLRQGALEGVLVAAVAKAAKVPLKHVRRATMLSGRLPDVARAALTAGREGVDAFRIELFRPLAPMLAQPSETVADALGTMAGPAAFEAKLDGARVQVHKRDGDVRIYSRALNDVTASLPEVVASTRALPVRTAILDGEVIALRDDGRPRPFQETMTRFGRRLDVAAMRETMPLNTFFFDLLYRDGAELLDAPTRDRHAHLADLVPEALRAPRIVTADDTAAQAFLDETLARGHEGVMVKSLSARYEAGSRGASWLKLKPVHTLDLVVLAAEWGSGRRKGTLSNLHLGARDPRSGGFVMLGKTFKGLTDKMLAWQTEHLLSIATERAGHIVRVAPTLVVEIAFNELQASTRYPGGLALRFARVKGYRTGKRADEADTIDTVKAIHDAARR